MKFLKKFFIPHKENNFKPHLFRKTSLVSLFLIVIFVFSFTVFSRVVIDKTGMTALVLPKVLVDYANKDRQENNFQNLTINPLLEKAAKLKAQDMVNKGYFAHKSPDGHSPWYWLDQVGYDFSYAGENLAVNFNDSVDVNNAWMNSPGHKANILNGNFTEIGIATVDGMYEGRMTTFVVQFFGRPAKNQKQILKTEIVTNKVKEISLTDKKDIVTTASSSVLGASGENELYVAVQNKESENVSTTSSKSYSNFFEKILLSPTKTLSFIYIFIGIIILLGLIGLIFSEIREHHLFGVVIGVILLLLIIILSYIYKAILIEPVFVI